MSDRLKRETIIEDVWVTKPISETAVNEAYDAFRSQYIGSPTKLVMHPEASMDFVAGLKEPSMNLTPNTYMGMDFELDRDLDEKEWCVRLSVSKTWAIE